MSVNLRDKIRSAILGVPAKSFEVSVAGVSVEFRQPPVGVILEAAKVEDRKLMMANMIINFCFVPGTGERVFEDTDAEAIMSIPFGEEWVKIQEAIDKLTNLTEIQKDKAKNSTPEA